MLGTVLFIHESKESFESFQDSCLIEGMTNNFIYKQTLADASTYLFSEQNSFEKGIFLIEEKMIKEDKSLFLKKLQSIERLKSLHLILLLNSSKDLKNNSCKELGMDLSMKSPYNFDTFLDAFQGLLSHLK